MVRVLIAALVVVWVGSADAAPKHKVKIITEPAGATIYIGATEEGPACEPTPCTIEVPPGETSIVIDLEDYQRKYENVIVAKNGKAADAKFTLVPAKGTIAVSGPVGASVTIDGKDEGTAPAVVEVAAKGHKVVVILNGKTLYDDVVEVAPGAEVEIEPKKVAIGDDGGDGDGDDGDGGDGDGGAITGTGTPPTAPRDRYASLGLQVDFGARSFVFVDASGRNIKPGRFNESIQVLVGPALELWPGSMAGVRFLRGLSIFARYQYGLNKQPIELVGETKLVGEANTFWASSEVSLRHRWTFAKRVTVEIGGGYVRDQYQFEATPADRAKAPDVDYKAFRIGGRASLLFPYKSGRIEPFLTFENRAIQSGGLLETKFAKADPSGYRASVGVAMLFGRVTARIEAAAIQFSWDLTPSATPTIEASAATDAIRVIGVSAGYEY